MNGGQLSILLIDDSEQEYTTLNALLSKIEGCQFELEQVFDYQTALAKMEERQHNVCLLNPHLSKATGLDRLRQTFENGNIPPLILLTGSEDQDEIPEVIKNEAVDYLVKGHISLPALNRAIRYALKYTQLKDTFERQLQERTSELTHENKELHTEIIQWKHREAVREERERLYRDVFDVDIYGVEILDAQGIITDCNTTYERLLGYSRDEIVGRHATTFTSARGTKRLKKKLTLLRKRGDTEGEIDLICKDGSKILVWRRFQALFDENEVYVGAVAYSRDITERMQAVRQISSLARALEQSPAATMIMDDDGIVEYINFSFTELTGFSYEEVVGQHLRFVKSAEESPETFEELWQAVRTGQEWHGEYRNLNKDGLAYWEALTVAPMYNNRGQITHFIAVQEDISARKQVEEEAMRSQRRVGDLMTEQISDLTLANEKLQREVADRKRIEQTLQRNRTRLKAQYKGIPVPTYTWQRTGDDFVLVDYNDAAERVSQRRIADFLGKTVSVIFKDNPQIITDFSYCFTKRNIVKREAPYTLITTGETRYFVTTYNFVPPHLVIVHIQDITEHKKVKEELKQVEDELTHYRQKSENIVQDQSRELDRKISEHRQFLAALRQTRAMLTAQYKCIPIPTYTWRSIDGDFMLIDYNDAAERSSQGRIVDFLNKKASNIFQDRPTVLADFASCTREMPLIKREAPYRLITTGETRHFVTTYNFVSPDMVIVYIEDVTNYKRMEKALQASAEQIELSCRLAPDTTLTFVNDAFCWYFNQDREALIGQQIPFVLPEDRRTVETHFSALDQGNPVGAVECRVTMASENIRWLRWISQAIFDEKGQLVEFQAVGRDITRRKAGQSSNW